VGGKRTLAHVGKRLVVDDVIAMAGAQQTEEIEPPLGARDAKPGEMCIADLGATNGTTSETVTNYSGGAIAATGEPTSSGAAGSEKRPIGAPHPFFIA
jgi:hypothetical protein